MQEGECDALSSCFHLLHHCLSMWVQRSVGNLQTVHNAAHRKLPTTAPRKEHDWNH